MAVSEIDLGRVFGCKPKGIDIEEPSLVGRWGEKNVAGITIGMKDAVPAASKKEAANGGKSAGAGGGGGTRREKGGKIEAVGNVGGEDIDPPEKAGGVKEGGLDGGGGDLSWGEEGTTLDFFERAAGMGVQVLADFTPEASVHAGADHELLGFVDWQ